MGALPAEGTPDSAPAHPLLRIMIRTRQPGDKPIQLGIIALHLPTMATSTTPRNQSFPTLSKYSHFLTQGLAQPPIYYIYIG